MSTNQLEHTFTLQFNEHQNIVHKICKIYTNDQETHKDLFQEVTIQAWKSFPKFKGNSKFSTWLYKVALNVALTFLKKEKKKVVVQDFDSVSYKIKDEEYDNTQEQQLKQLYTAIKKLNDIEKAIIYLYLENKTGKEIAEITGLTEVSIRVKINRTKQKLKQLLNQ